jgi:hypothetical protein
MKVTMVDTSSRFKHTAGPMQKATGTQLGKRYFCENCGTEVLCSKAGTGTRECCGQPMKIKEAKPLPSSD